VKLLTDDLFETPLDQIQIDFENEGGETYICGNPPYLGSKWQSAAQKTDLGALFDGRVKNWKSLDYVAAWFLKAADYGTCTPSSAAFVATNSICQGQQVPTLWPEIFATGNACWRRPKIDPVCRLKNDPGTKAVFWNRTATANLPDPTWISTSDNGNSGQRLIVCCPPWIRTVSSPPRFYSV
jgi:hypothetical protein